jgi:archaemetzincin
MAPAARPASQTLERPAAEKICVVAMGRVPAVAPRVVAAHIHAFFGLPAEVLPGLPAPVYALDAGRMQFDAGKIIQRLEREAFPGCRKWIGVVEGDLFVPIFTYVLGEARQGGKCALVSLCRLAQKRGPGASPQPTVLERCAKVALHELGHLFGIVHCPDPLCVMHISGDVRELDQRRLALCRYCRRQLDQRLCQP